MDIDKFKSNLETASLMAVSIAQLRVINFLSDNVQYRIQPDSVSARNDLTDLEQRARMTRIREANKIFNVDDVLERLWNEGKVPTYVTVSIYKATNKVTILNLFVDSKYTNSELLDETMEPFQPVLDIPVYMDPSDETKFDANWRHKKWQLRYRMWKRKKELRRSIKNVGWWKGLE
jgi:hypothetical protein